MCVGTQVKRICPPHSPSQQVKSVQKHSSNSRASPSRVLEGFSLTCSSCVTYFVTYYFRNMFCVSAVHNKAFSVTCGPAPSHIPRHTGDLQSTPPSHFFLRGWREPQCLTSRVRFSSEDFRACTVLYRPIVYVIITAQHRPHGWKAPPKLPPGPY